ncbi:unnamed protein product, partial [Symbiodinium pilosum]
MPVSSFEHIYKDTNLAQSVLTRAGRWNCATETIEAAVAALGGGTDKVPEHQSGEASSDLEPPSEVFSEAPEMEADDFEEASFYAGGLGSIVRVDSSSNLPVVFRHRSSRVVHISREDHPDDEGEMSVLVCGRVANAMAAVDSEALFKAKRRQLKLPDDAATKMTAKGWTAYGAFAFAVPGDPGKISDSDFRSIVCQPVLGSEQEHVPKLRRLHFEAFAITAAELKRTAEVQESDQPRKLPAVELAARYDVLQQRVKPLRLVDKLEPSQALVNHAAHMLEEQRIKYVEWFRCTSRAQEVNAVKEDSSLKLLQSSKEGAVLLRDPESGLRASTGSDLEVMQALRRRGAAYDLAAIMSFEAHEKLIDALFSEYRWEVTPGHHPVSFSQLQMVDRGPSEMTRSGLAPTASGGMPLDDVIVQVLALPAIHWKRKAGSMQESATHAADKS